MATYVYDQAQGCMVDKDTGLPMNPEGLQGPMPTPMVMPDTPGYRSPIDGRWIEGRRARKYDLESNGCIEAGDRPTKKLKNERFAAKHGLQHLME